MQLVTPASTFVPGINRVHVLRGVIPAMDRHRLCESPAATRHHSDDDPIGIRKNMALPGIAAKILGKIDASMVAPSRPVNVDQMMRLYRLEGGQGAVERHVDEDFVGPNGSRARFSVLVFLNSGYEGGETVFSGSPCGLSCDAGDALLFAHNIPHEGLPVRRGVKFVLKTDLFVEE